MRPALVSLAFGDHGSARPAVRTLRHGALAIALVMTGAGCGLDRHTAVDVAMGSAYRPPVFTFDTPDETRRDRHDIPRDPPEPFHLLAGDFHCHVSPPDWDQEANRDLTAAQPRGGEVASLVLDPARCSVIRAEIDGGAAAPIYANCAFAE